MADVKRRGRKTSELLLLQDVNKPTSTCKQREKRNVRTRQTIKDKDDSQWQKLKSRY
jgi:hypothetical protein